VTENSHPSEKCVFEFSGNCIPINNNHSLDDLKDQIEGVLSATEVLSTIRNRA
jgi:hypothetical protein